MKRQRGRNRGGGGSSGGNTKPTQNANRAFDSNGPEGVKVRGNAQHVFEKYQQLARDANAAGDRVLAENYLQHAEHYFRLIRAISPNRPPSEIIGRDQFASGYDIDFEDESGQPQGEPFEAGAPEPVADTRQDSRQDGGGDRGQWQARDDRPRDDRPRDDRPRDERPRDERPRDERPRDERPRDDRGRDDRPRDDRPRDDRPRNDSGREGWRDRDGGNNTGGNTGGSGNRNRSRNDRPRDDRPREDRPRDERPREERPREERVRAEGEEPRRERFERQERSERVERDPLPVVQPQGDPAPTGPMLRDSEGGASHAPAFLQARPTPAPTLDAGEEKPKRRRRAPRSVDVGEGAPPPETEQA